jgi:hypothetical protein
MRIGHSEWLKCRKSPFLLVNLILYASLGGLLAIYLSISKHSIGNQSLINVLDMISLLLPFTIVFNTYFLVEIEENEHRYYTMFVIKEKWQYLLIKILFSLTLLMCDFLLVSIGFSLMATFLNLSSLSLVALILLFIKQLVLSIPFVLLGLYLALNQTLSVALFLGSLNTLFTMIFTNFPNFSLTAFFPWSWVHINNVQSVNGKGVTLFAIFIIWGLCAILTLVLTSLFFVWFSKWEGERSR